MKRDDRSRKQGARSRGGSGATLFEGMRLFVTYCVTNGRAAARWICNVLCYKRVWVVACAPRLLAAEGVR